MSASSTESPACLTVQEVANYLRINEKKVYELVKEGSLPATKVTGKWLFPRRLVEEWLLESAHAGVLADRLLVAGSDDPLLATALAWLAADVGDAALVALSLTGTRGGLELLSRGRANVCGMHWGSSEASDAQHWRLVRGFPGHHQWTLVRMARREQGVMLSPRVGGSRVARGARGTGAALGAAPARRGVAAFPAQQVSRPRIEARQR